MVELSVLRMTSLRGWRTVRIVLLGALVTACNLDHCTSGSGEAPGPGTPEFLDANDFAGSYDAGSGNVLYGGSSVFGGRLVFANLPRTLVDDVLPDNLQLADNTSTTLPNEHPVLLLQGTHADPLWIFPYFDVDIGMGYNELILLIPFVQRAGGSKWQNYVTRIYLDNKLAEVLGNKYFGYLKEMAEFEEENGASDSTLEVFVAGNEMFTWTSVPDSPDFLASETAVTGLDNYANAVQILGMPILGTFVDMNGLHVCSYWNWDLSDAEVRPISVDLRFLKEFRDGMKEWVDYGPMQSVPKGSFQIVDVRWSMAFPPVKCSF